MSERFGSFLIASLELFAAAVMLVAGAVVMWVIVTYILDVTQTRHAVRRNYPVIGRFRYFFEHLGPVHGGRLCQRCARLMFALGCIQALQCSRNTCPTGITTHDEKLQRGLHPTPALRAEACRQQAP